MKNTYFRIAATFLLMLAIGLEANHSFIQQVAWKGFEPAANLVSIPLIASWALAALSLWSAKATLKPWMVLGIFLLVMHGIVISLGGNGLGLAYLLSGILTGVCSAISHIGEASRIRGRSRPRLKLAS